MPNYDLGTAEGKIVLDTSGIDNSVSQANQSMGRLGRGAQNAQRTGRQLTTGLTLPIVAIGGYALKTAIDFESAFTGVTKTVNGTESEIAGLRQGIIDMSQRIPASTTEIAGVAEAAGQLGIAVGDIEEFTETMIALGVSTNLTSEQAAVDIARITNIMGTDVGDLGQFGAALVGLGNSSATTEKEILEMANRIAGIANLSDSSEADMLGLAASLSSVGVRAEAGGTAVTKTIKDFDEWSTSIRNAGEDADEMGGKAKQFYDLLGGAEEFAAFDKLSGVEQVEVFVKKLQEAEAGGANLIETLGNLGLQEIRQSDSILRLVGAEDLLSETLLEGRTAWEESTALTNEAEKRYKTTASQLQIVKNKAENAARILGEAMLPVLIDLIDAITPLFEGLALLAEGFASLPDPIRNAVLMGIAFLAIIGPILFIGGKLVTTGIALFSALKLIAVGFQILTGAMALNPFVLIVLAVIALVVGMVLLYKKSEKFREFIKQMGREIVKIWGKVLEFFKNLPGHFKKIWSRVKKEFEAAKDAVIGAWNAVVDFFKRLPGVIGEAVSDATKAFLDWLTNLPELIGYWLGFALGRFVLWTHQLIELIRETGARFVRFLIAKMTEFAMWLPGFLTGLITDIIAWGIELILEVREIARRFVAWFIDTLIALPGQIFGILVSIVKGLPGFAVDLYFGAKEMGGKFISGFLSGVGDFAFLIWNMIKSAIDGIGGLAQDGYNKMRSIGTAMWRGFKAGLDINSPSNVEEAAFDIRDNVGIVLNALSAQVRSMQTLGRRIPSTMPSSQFGQLAAAMASSGGTGQSSTVSADPGGTFTVQGPLIGQATIRDNGDVELLAEEMDRLAARKRRAAGGGNGNAW